MDSRRPTQHELAGLDVQQPSNKGHEGCLYCRPGGTHGRAAGMDLFPPRTLETLKIRPLRHDTQAAVRTSCSRGVGSCCTCCRLGDGASSLVAILLLRLRCDVEAWGFSVTALVLPTSAVICSTKLLNTWSAASVTPNPTLSTSSTSSRAPPSGACVSDCPLDAIIHRGLTQREHTVLELLIAFPENSVDLTVRRYMMAAFPAHEYTCCGTRGLWMPSPSSQLVFAS